MWGIYNVYSGEFEKEYIVKAISANRAVEIIAEKHNWIRTSDLTAILLFDLSEQEEQEEI